MSWTLTQSWTIICGSRRDQEEGGGAGPRRLLLPLFLNSCATDIVLVTQLRTAVETAIAEYTTCCVMVMMMMMMSCCLMSSDVI